MAVVNRGPALACSLFWPQLNRYPGKERSKRQDHFAQILSLQQRNIWISSQPHQVRE